MTKAEKEKFLEKVTDQIQVIASQLLDEIYRDQIGLLEGRIKRLERDVTALTQAGV